MRLFFPIIEAKSLCILNSWSSPLLRKDPVVSFGSRQNEVSFLLEDPPPPALEGTVLWESAITLASRGRETHWILSSAGSGGYPLAFSVDSTLRILAREDGNLPPILMHLAGRPPLEIQDPKALLAFHLAGDMAAPLDFSLEEKESLRYYILSQPMMMVLAHPYDLPDLFLNAPARERERRYGDEGVGGRNGGRLTGDSEWERPENHASNRRGGRGGAFYSDGNRERPGEGRVFGKRPPYLEDPEVKTVYPGWKLFLKKDYERSSAFTERALSLPEDQPWAPHAAGLFALYPFDGGGVCSNDSETEEERPENLEDPRAAFVAERKWRRFLKDFFGHVPNSESLPDTEDGEDSFLKTFLRSGKIPGGLINRAVEARRKLFPLNENPREHILVTGAPRNGKSALGLLFLLGALRSAGAALKNSLSLLAESVQDIAEEQTVEGEPNLEAENASAFSRGGRKRGAAVNGSGKGKVCFIAPGRVQRRRAWENFLELSSLSNTFELSQNDVIIFPPREGEPQASPGDDSVRAVFVSYEDCGPLLLDGDFLKNLSAVVIDDFSVLRDPLSGWAPDAALAMLSVLSAERRLTGKSPLRLMLTGRSSQDEARELERILSLKNSPRGPVVAAPLKLESAKSLKAPARVAIQATCPEARFRALTLKELRDPKLAPADFLLDGYRGSNFKNIVTGWLPGEEKVVYASPASKVLFGFTKFILEMGRGEVDSVSAAVGLTERLANVLKGEGFSREDGEFHLEFFRRGIFHYCGFMGERLRLLMLEAFRSLAPLKNEPFILAGDSALSEISDFPASSLFLDGIFWSKSRLDSSVGMEIAEYDFVEGFRRSLLDREGKPPLLLINWHVWRGFDKNDLYQFSFRKNKLFRLFSSERAEERGGTELETALGGPGRRKKLSELPPPLERFFLAALGCSLKLGKGAPAKLSGMTRFLDNTRAGGSLLSQNRSKNAANLANSLFSYYGLVTELFPGVFFEEIRVKGRDGRIKLRYREGELLAPLLSRNLDVQTFGELKEFLDDIPSESKWREPSLFALLVLLLIPLLKSFQGDFPRVFLLETPPRQPGSEGFSLDAVKAHLFFREVSASFTARLESCGVNPVSAREMALKILGFVNSIVKGKLDNSVRPAGGAVFQMVRDSVLEFVFPREERILRWLEGEDFGSLRESMRPGERGAGEKQPESPFDFECRKKILGVFSFFTLLERKTGGIPKDLLNSLERTEEKLAKRICLESRRQDGGDAAVLS
ncbi:MAG: hypothetical protein LBR53_08540 [Deltaproteobacteria bacterium]|jgi:hypothetical protein|nr:hypothetical protein [Deltaproteobacteria bacterium]